ncbi:unnamed protein product [Soboliphyme baturini]|uniref:Ig-like domain-containing protein n=1 Tax=Soboliphyme baturini TaxID=241478 RepID=A0A183IIJ0_9BILA|nr:unnamed protein product [Soboliphyme baturini]
MKPVKRSSRRNRTYYEVVKRLVKRESEGDCRWGEAKCRSGECILREYVCDGTKHCLDGSDEQDCGIADSCEASEFHCDNNNCIEKSWLCDGQDDCEDGSDERNCESRPVGTGCAAYEFQCVSTKECISAGFQCDGQNDCPDESDEIGCAPPVAVQPPIQFLRIGCGERAVLECRAVGVPTPYINWRLNWGKTCGPPRCTQTSEHGHGILVISNANTFDQGVYTCEALNSKGRLLVTPDAVLKVDCQQQCNRAGTLYQSSDKKCVCKQYVQGEFCDRCVEGTFQLTESNPHGCLECFCSGLTNECQNADLFKATV